MPFAKVHNRRSIIYIENLTDALFHCANEPGASDQLFLVADDMPVSTPELIFRMAAVMGRPVRLWPVPKVFLRAAATVSQPWLSFSPLIDSLEIDWTHIHKTIGWFPPYCFQEALERTFAK